MSGSEKSEVDLFTEALQLPADKRSGFLDAACAGDVELRASVEALLKAHMESGEFLEQSPAEVKAQHAQPGEKVGDRIGRYKLLQQIGEGGCGVVFMAEQQEPVRRKVAIKIVKPGMDTKNVIARFEAERQALALMDHPNIAQVFDAGATDSGRPYFIMELVRGIKITDYCDQDSLKTADRLGMFVEVCDAVQHAHQKGIIHRDLKPSNILVTTLPSGKPLAKVIDFGIAKATTDQQLTDKTLFTAFELLIGTPAYMSPEQAALSIVDVDTRSDIYSLGVLLYELLTGSTPFDTTELLKRGLDEVRRVVCNVEPPRPSTRLSTLIAADLTSVSRRRHVEPPKLIREVRGDLDWIVMKALEKDRARRYTTVNGFAMDIRRYLAGEAISARPPSAFYKLYKLATRNKLWFGAASLVLATLVAGLTVTTHSLEREKRALRAAEASRRRAESDEQKALAESTQSREVTAFLQEMLAGVGPSVARGRDTTMLGEILEKTSERVGRDLTNQPAVQAELWNTIGRVWAQLRLADKAEPMLRQALAARRKLYGEESPAVADSVFDLARVSEDKQNWAEAESLCRESLAIRRKLYGEESTQTCAALHLLGDVYYQQGRTEEAEALQRQVLAERRELLGGEHMDVAQSLGSLGNILEHEGKLADAETAYREALAIHRKLVGNDDLFVARTLGNLALVLRDEGNLAEAEVMQRQVLAGLRKSLDEFHLDVTISVVNLSEILRRENKRDGVAPILKPLLQTDVAAHPEAAPQLLLRADALARRAFWTEARADAARVLKFRPTDEEVYHFLAPLSVACEDFEGYKGLCREMVAHYAGTTNASTADVIAKDCLILPSSGANLDSVAVLAETAVTYGKGEIPYTFYQCTKALADYRQGKYPEAVARTSAILKDPFPYTQAEGSAVLAMAQFRLGQTNEAHAALAKLDKIVQEALPAPGSRDLGSDWKDWIIAHALLDEASDLIKSADSTNLDWRAIRHE